MRQAGEPTVEEILESIKQVIARDNRCDAADERRRRETSGVVTRDEAIAAGEGAIGGGIGPDDILDLAESGARLPDAAPGEPDANEPALIAESLQASMRESLEALSVLSEPGMPPQIVRSGETSLEGLARELLRPALAEWLEKHLPPLVERMVAAEISRIVGKKN